MDPRYQIFTSSTFRDLIPERQVAMDAILELGHFPAGMEAFPAASVSPWDLIQRIIAESDYYVLIVAGKYGSIDPATGVGYTEQEYDFAFNMGIPTLAFLHKDPMQLAGDKLELDPGARQKLDEFRKKVAKRHCNFWTSPQDLKSAVMLGLVHEMRRNPRVGWIRADERDSPGTLRRLNALLEQNAEMTQELEQLRQQLVQPISEHRFAHENEEVTIRFKVSGVQQPPARTTWKELFEWLAPGMIYRCEYATLIGEVLCHISSDKKLPGFHIMSPLNGHTSMDPEDWHKITMQFLALEYWEAVECTRTWTSGDTEVKKEQVPGWKLTQLGVKRLAQAKAMVRGSIKTD
jgi:hypothetical protein